MIHYVTQRIPHENGVYACRVVLFSTPVTEIEDKFLIWHDGWWQYTHTYHRCHNHVIGWIGPLPRTKL